MSYPWDFPLTAFHTEEGDPDYKKELARCPEFTLYEHFREGGPTSVELSPEVERAYHRVQMNANDAKGQTDKIAMARLLDTLGELGKLWESEDENKDRVIEIFGQKLFPEIVQRLGVPIAKALSQNVSKRETALRDVSTAFRGGTESLHRKYAPMLGKAADGRALLPVKQMLIPIAIQKFRETRERPTKSTIQSFLKGMGYRSEKNWEEKFKAAGLSHLPK
jgi:hypothetical protein